MWSVTAVALPLWCAGLAPVPRALPPAHAALRAASAPRMVAHVADGGEGHAAIAPNLLQAEAIRTSSDSVLLLASPGTGKTRVIRSRLACLLSKGVSVSSILVVTFTQHAAQQLKLRVGTLPGAASIDRVRLGTFHSICASMLREHADKLALSRDFVVLVESEQLSLLSALMSQVGMAGGPGGGTGRSTSPSTSAILKVIQRWKESGLKPTDVQHAAGTAAPDGSGFGAADAVSDDDATRLARRLYPEYQRRLWERGVLDYSDLTRGALKLFQQHPQVLEGYRQRYKHILVDELQDTSPMQYEWLRRLSGPYVREKCLFWGRPLSANRPTHLDTTLRMGFWLRFLLPFAGSCMLVQLLSLSWVFGLIAFLGIAVRETDGLGTAAILARPESSLLFCRVAVSLPPSCSASNNLHIYLFFFLFPVYRISMPHTRLLDAGRVVSLLRCYHCRARCPPYAPREVFQRWPSPLAPARHDMVL